MAARDNEPQCSTISPNPANAANISILEDTVRYSLKSTELTKVLQLNNWMRGLHSLMRKDKTRSLSYLPLCRVYCAARVA
jgi:hypothetical protein